MRTQLRRLFQAHSLVITLLILIFAWGLTSLLRLNFHFIDPFNYTLKEYRLEDIVYSRFIGPDREHVEEIVLVHVGQPDRAEMAWMIEKISGAGARVIGLDVLLDGRKRPLEDSLLQASIRKAGNVVLACELTNHNPRLQRFEHIGGCDPMFQQVGRPAYVNFPVKDPYQTIRMFSPEEPLREGTILSFPAAIAKLYDETALQELKERNQVVENIHYTGPKESFTILTKEQILYEDFTPQQLEATLNDKIVLIGYLGDEKLENSLLDCYYTPLNPKYSGRSPPDMYGMVIMANIIHMIVSRDYLHELPPWGQHLLTFLVCYLNVLLIHWIYRRFNVNYHGIVRILQLGESLLLFFLFAFLFYHFDLNLPLGRAVLCVVLAYDAVMIYESNLREKLPGLYAFFDKS